jgi:hypothetical protein
LKRFPRLTRRGVFVVLAVLAVLGAAVASAVISTGGSSTAAKSPELAAPAGAKSASGAKSSSSSSAVGSGPIVSQAIHHDVSPPLRTLKSTSKLKGIQVPHESDEGMPPTVGSKQPDPVVQSKVGTGQIPATSANFAGLSAGDAGGTYIPPDPNGTVGPSNYFEIANAMIAIYTKTGTKVYGPVSTNTLFSGFGGACQSDDDGDGTVVYDQLANRWVVQQFAVETTPYLECVAVSTSGDPTGTYNRYSFSYTTNFNDYPKLAVWPDAYYTTYDIFANGQSYTGPEACALDRSSMIAGLSATQQCFKLGASVNPLLPSTVEGSTPPPSGSPNYVLSSASSGTALQEWKFHVDWTTPANSTFTGPASIAVSSFSQACGGGACIPQSGTTTKLDSLGDRLMYPLGYRNFGDHESLVVDQSVTAGSSVGMRWYEIRTPGTAPSVFQQGTYAPDGAYRWMGSVAMDHVGDMGLGFSISSSSTHPGVRYTGRLVSDALGTMGQGEGTVVTGNGSQINAGDCNPDQCSYRWGDYTSMQVDPSDDCTFWYVNEYIPTTGEFNWKTQIASFKFPSCTGGGGGGAPVVNSFNPTQGPVGTSVDVLGSGFTGVTGVTFNGQSASFTFNSDSEVHATVPSGATTGPIAVTTPGGTGQSSTNFTVTTGGGNPPTVTSFTPTSGPVGTNVTITGTNFTGATAVTFNGTAATSFTVNSSTQIQANVPAGATTGKIAVTTPNGTGTSSTNFTVTTSGGGSPTITGFTPTQGFQGTKVTITGTNFTGTTSVKLGTTAAVFTVNSSTSITATVPNPHFLGSYHWVVTTPSGTATSTALFRFL